MKQRLIALLLVVVMLAGSFAGCSTDTPEPTPAPVQPSDPAPEQPDTPTDVVPTTEYVYQASYLPLDNELMEPYLVETITSFCVSGKTAYLSAQCIDPEASTEPYYDPVTDEMFEGEQAYVTQYFSLDLDTMKVQPLRYEPSKLKEGREGVYLLSDVYPGADGTVWIAETVESFYYDLPSDFDAETDSMWNYYVSDTPVVTLMQFDASGALKDVKQHTLLKSTGSVYSVIPDAVGNLYVATPNTVFVFNSTQNLITPVSVSGGFLHHLGSRGVSYVTYIGNEQQIQIIDPITAAFTDNITIENASWKLGHGNAEYDCTFVQNGVLFGRKPQSETDAVILDWLRVDVNANNIQHFDLADDGAIYAITYENGSCSLVCISLTDSSKVPAEKTLVLGTAFLSSDVRQAVIDFNKAHTDFRIDVWDYSLSSMQVNGLQGIDALMADLSAGIIPDLILTDDLPVVYLASKDMLMDLKPLIDADSTLSGNALMTKLYDTVAIDGKIYEAAPWFTISTAATGADLIAGNAWNIDAANTAQSTLNTGATALGTTAALHHMISAYVYENADAFIDWNSATCSFNSKEFLEILNYINRINQEISTISGKKSSDYKRIYSKMQLMTAHQIDDLYDLKYVSALYQNKAAMVGYPVENGSLNVLRLVNPIAITASCSNSGAAWEFVRTFLTLEYQQAGKEMGFPTNSAAFDAYVQRMMTPVYTTDADGNQIEVSNGSVKLDDILSLQLYAVTKEEYSLFTSLYEHCNLIGRTNQALTNILAAEISNMLGGVSPEATAAAMQTAVEAYLSSLK